MICSAFFALGLVCLVQMTGELPRLLLVPELASGMAMVIWHLFGPRVLFSLVPSVWAGFNAGWVLDDRLDPPLSGQDIIVQGTICDFPRHGSQVYRFLFELDHRPSLSGVPRRIYLSWYDTDLVPKAGETWRFKARLKRPRGLSNPGAFDFERWTFVRAIGATGYIRESAINRRLPANLKRCQLTRFRSQVAGLIEGELNDDRSVGYLLALAVGVRSQLTPSDWELLRRTGTAHLVAISGLHVGLVAALCVFLGRRIGRIFLWLGVRCEPLVAGRYSGLTGAVIYSALAGFAVSTIRALAMVAVVILLTGLHRRAIGWEVLAVALYTVLLAEPTAPLSAGFWLSFLAVGLLLIKSLDIGGLAGTPRWSATGAGRRLTNLVQVQVILMLGMAPLAIFLFAQVSLIAPVANFLAVPIFTVLIVPLVLIGTVTIMMSSSVGGLILWCAGQIIAGVLYLIESLDRLPFSVWQVPPFSNVVLLLVFFAALILIWPQPIPGRLLVIAGLLPCIVASGPAPDTVPLRVVVMDVGHGLAVLVQTPGHVLLYDSGPAFRSRDAGQTIVLPVLRYFGVKRLDTLVISHQDLDHRGGAGSILEAFPRANLISSETFGPFPDRYRRCASGHEWNSGPVSFRILHPEAAIENGTWSDNDGSCVLLVESAQVRVLLPGDIEGPAERHLERNGKLLPVDLLIAPHHGSQSSSSQAFVESTQPRYVVFSAGYANRWGLPRSEVLARWSSTGACLYTTAQSGALVFEASDTGGVRLIRRQRVDGKRLWTDVESSETACD